MYQYRAQVLEVKDGDTIVCMTDLGFSIFQKMTLRLNGINTPEIHTRNAHEKELGFKAKDFLTAQVQGKEIVLNTVKSEKFGRILADITCEDVHINQLMITEGYAREYHGESRKDLTW